MSRVWWERCLKRDVPSDWPDIRWKERGTIRFIPELVHNLASALALRAPLVLDWPRFLSTHFKCELPGNKIFQNNLYYGHAEHPERAIAVTKKYYCLQCHRSNVLMLCGIISVNTLTAKVVSRWRDPQLQVSENYSDLTKWRATLFKSCWLMSHFIFTLFKNLNVVPNVLIKNENPNICGTGG